MTALERLQTELAEMAADKREDVAERLLRELKRARRDEIIAGIEIVEGAHSPKHETELLALLEEAEESLERGEGIPLEDLDLIGGFRARHGID